MRKTAMQSRPQAKIHRSKDLASAASTVHCGTQPTVIKRIDTGGYSDFDLSASLPELTFSDIYAELRTFLGILPIYPRIITAAGPC